MKKPERYEIDFYKEFALPRPVQCGLVHKITSPKGIRLKDDKTGLYHYRLHNDLVQIYEGKPALVEKGLYWVMDVYKLQGTMTWNHYLFVVEPDGTVYPISEFLYYQDSTWIKESINIIKDWYKGDLYDPIKITPIKGDFNRNNSIKR